jgi:hypothetical protein
MYPTTPAVRRSIELAWLYTPDPNLPSRAASVFRSSAIQEILVDSARLVGYASASAIAVDRPRLGLIHLGLPQS